MLIVALRVCARILCFLRVALHTLAFHDYAARLKDQGVRARLRQRASMRSTSPRRISRGPSLDHGGESTSAAAAAAATTSVGQQQSPPQQPSVTIRPLTSVGSGVWRARPPNLHQDSIAEEDSREPSPCPPRSPSLMPPPSSPLRFSSASSGYGDMFGGGGGGGGGGGAPSSPIALPTLRKGSLSPGAARYSSASLAHTNATGGGGGGGGGGGSGGGSSASTRRRGFQSVRTPSAAQSDCTDAQTTSRPQAPLQTQLSGSCESTRIRFEICGRGCVGSSGGSSLRNSNSSSLHTRGPSLPVPAVVGSGGAGSLRANGYVPRLSPPRDPARWRLSATKQRSQSESAFGTIRLVLPTSGGSTRDGGGTLPNGGVDAYGSSALYHCHHHHRPHHVGGCCSGGGGGGGEASGVGGYSSLSGISRRASMTILNPHKEQALLRRILGPSALDWLKGREPPSTSTATAAANAQPPTLPNRECENKNAD